MVKDKYLWSGVIASFVLVFDQVTKYAVLRYIPRRGTITVIPGWFDLTNVRNPGAAFGILAGDHGLWRKVFFIAVTCVALAAIVVFLRKAQERLLVAAFALIAGGAVGNLIDRIRFGEVVDFIDWYYRSWHWPTFNVADSAISAGVCLLAVDMFLSKRREPRET